MAGRLDKLVKPQTVSTNFKSLSQLFPPRQKTWRQLYYGRIVTSVQHFCMCILQQNLILQKTKQAHFMSNSLAQFGSKFDTIWPSEIALNGKQTHKCVSKHTWTRTTMHYAPIYQQSNSWWRMLWLRNCRDLLHESNLIPKISWNRGARVMPKVQCHLALKATHFDSVQF